MRNIKCFDKIVSNDGVLQVQNLPFGKYRIVKISKYEKILDYIKIFFMGFGIFGFIVILLGIQFFYFNGGKEFVKQEQEKIKMCESILKMK